MAWFSMLRAMPQQEVLALAFRHELPGMLRNHAARIADLFTKFEIINAFDVDFKKTSLDPVLHSRKF